MNGIDPNNSAARPPRAPLELWLGKAKAALLGTDEARAAELDRQAAEIRSRIDGAARGMRTRMSLVQNQAEAMARLADRRAEFKSLLAADFSQSFIDQWVLEPTRIDSLLDQYRLPIVVRLFEKELKRALSHLEREIRRPLLEVDARYREIRVLAEQDATLPAPAAATPMPAPPVLSGVAVPTGIDDCASIA
jgi:hypothetical protein